jgi:alkylation response protein AidB-like acyl-CoA dehydrogenase
VDRAVLNKAGANGYLCMTVPEQYGGAGGDKLYSVVQMEELAAPVSAASALACTVRSSRPTSCTTAPASRSSATCRAWLPARWWAPSIDGTVQYVKERKVFGQSVAAFQNTRYKLAELQSQVQVARVFVDKCLEPIMANQLDTATASMAKYWTSDLQCQVMDECVQLHGGYGYMWEYPITRAFADARVQRIYGGTNEIMKEVISRGMGLGGR